MKLYNLPRDDEFLRDIINDLKRAKVALLISPFLSLNVIREWRKSAENVLNENFTIIYDLEETSTGEEKGLHGEADDELIPLIKWKRCKGLHSKVYYFEFEGGYSFYHGSANLTNRGVGSIERDYELSRNIEIMSRITGDISLNQSIQDIIAYYNGISEEEVPYFDYEKSIWKSSPTKRVLDGIIKEYQGLIERLEPDSTYEPANSRYVLGNGDSNLTKVQGFFKSGNNRMIKFHTTNKAGNKAEFTISKVELKWFLGDFLKSNSKTKSKRLYLVWKLDGSFKGRLIIFRLYPLNIFDLFKESNRQKKLHIPYNSVTLSIVEEDEGYVLKRYNSCITIPREQVIKY